MPESAPLKMKRIVESSSPGAGWTHVWIIRIEQLMEKFEQHSRLLNHYEIERAKRFKFDRHQIRYINRWAAYRRILALYTNETPDKLEIERTSQGKPFLGAYAIDFSTSSSEGIAVVSISSDQIGIDIEQYNESGFFDSKSSASFLSPTESVYLQSVVPSQRQKLMLDCWTLKEAYLKGMGTGLLTDPRSVTLDLENKTLVTARGSASNVRWKMFQPELLDGYSLAIASIQSSTEIKYFEAEELSQRVYC